MFTQENNPKLSELAYLSYVKHSKWGLNFNLERGVERTLMQLRLPLFKGEGISWKYQIVNPKRVWATEDTLDHDQIVMIRAALQYILRTNKPNLPVVIWYIPYEHHYKYVCHDGHHRVYLHALFNIPIPAVVLDYWIDNREDPLLPQKLHYRQMDILVKDMDIIKMIF